MASKHAWKIDLIPWDHSSPEQVQRMVEQRLSCGWRADEVPSWTLSDAVPGQDQLIEKHVKAFPKETSPLRDTASEVRLVPRIPTNKEFMPIGHVALDIHGAEEDAELGLPSPGTAEALAAKEPMKATTMALDTMAKDMDGEGMFIWQAADTLDADSLEAVKSELKRSLPNSPEAWYERQGYHTYKRAPGYVFPAGNGVTAQLIVSYMKKLLR
ncbi:hypothetical protein GGR56DRAFT_669263 [Xylariaceae sp. FL0804]|nr:hypothetical protein GGR56DRAFT_669263 [Xylariaceae sp. FL0804]